MRKSLDAFFVEEQPLRDNPLLYVAFVVGVATIAYFGYAMFRQLVAGEPFGSRPMSDAGLAVFGGLYIAFGAVLLFLFFRGRLVTQVTPSGLFVRFFPFHRSFRRIPLEGVRSCRATTYRPVRDYGGWGIRVAPGKRAYNVSGNRGVELAYQDGKTVLIGSKKPEQLAGAIEAIRAVGTPPA